MKSKDLLRILEIVDNDKEKAKEIFDIIEKEQGIYANPQDSWKNNTHIVGGSNTPSLYTNTLENNIPNANCVHLGE